MPGIEVSLILPAFNEAGSIAQTIQETRRYFSRRGLTHEIIVAADGEDGTREIARSLDAVVLGEDTRRGKGRGVREAVARARGHYIGYADADNKVPIEEFDKVLPFLRSGLPVVIGSRAFGRSRIERPQPWYRRAGSAGFNLVVRTVVGLSGIPDTQCGFKFFQGAVARRLFEKQRIDGYMFDVEVLVLARRFGYRIEQVPIRWRDDGDTRLEMVRGNLRNMRDILRIRFGS